MFETFSTNALEIIDEALLIARELNKPLVGSEHLLLAMYKKNDTICHFLLEEKEISYNDILNIIKNLVIFRKENSNELTYSKKFQEIILYAETFAKDIGSKYVYDEHIFYVLLKEENSIASIVLDRLNIDKNDLMFDIEEIFNFFDFNKENQKILNEYPFLINLSNTKKVHPFIKRDDYIEKIIYILSKKQKNNPLLIGRAGVGKTAIVEGLANILKDDVIYQLDLGLIVSGTKYRGELEEKITKAMEFIKKEKAIVFIDEIHNIVGAGSNDGSLDIANILKPYLSRSDIKLIGATTLDEYYRFIEKDKALSRRFQNVFINEPTLNETYKIIKGIKQSYEEFHNVKFSDKLIKKIINDANLYLINKSFPDKAIDILDEIGARSNYQKKSLFQIENDVIETITGIKKLSINELKSINLNYPMLKTNYLNFLLRNYNIINSSNIGCIYVEDDFNIKPLINDLNKVFNLTNEMYLEIDLENYQDITSLNNLIGSSKGYVAYDQGGLLSEHILKFPISLIYLKNFSLSHISIQNFFKSLFKKEFFIDNKDRKIYLINTIFVISKITDNQEETGFIKNKNKDDIIKLKTIKEEIDYSHLINVLNKFNFNNNITNYKNINDLNTDLINHILTRN